MSLPTRLRALGELAVAALERPEPNVALAVGLLREIIGSEPVPAPKAEARGVSIGEAAVRLGFCAKTVRAMIRRGEVVAIGSGRTTRVLVDETIDRMRCGGSTKAQVPVADEVAAQGAEYVKRRAALRVVGGE